MEFDDLAQLLKGIADLPAVVKLLELQAREIQALKRDVNELLSHTCGSKDEGWMDARRAAAYLGMSINTFDKYRYQTTPKLVGYRVGGKIFYSRSDLDAFVKLFEIRSAGLM